jgi:hypothetical protein
MGLHSLLQGWLYLLPYLYIYKALNQEVVWESGSIAPPFLTPPLDGGKLLASRPGHFIPMERPPATRGVGGWMDARTSLDDVEKRKISCLCRESNIGHPVVARPYID